MGNTMDPTKTNGETRAHFDATSKLADERAVKELEFEFHCKEREFDFAMSCKRDEQNIKQLALIGEKLVPLSALLVLEMGKAILTLTALAEEINEKAEERKDARIAARKNKKVGK